MVVKSRYVFRSTLPPARIESAHPSLAARGVIPPRFTTHVATYPKPSIGQMVAEHDRRLPYVVGAKPAGNLIIIFNVKPKNGRLQRVGYPAPGGIRSMLTVARAQAELRRKYSATTFIGFAGWTTEEAGMMKDLGFGGPALSQELPPRRFGGRWDFPQPDTKAFEYAVKYSRQLEKNIPALEKQERTLDRRERLVSVGKRAGGKQESVRTQRRTTIIRAGGLPVSPLRITDENIGNLARWRNRVYSVGYIPLSMRGGRRTKEDRDEGYVATSDEALEEELKRS